MGRTKAELEEEIRQLRRQIAALQNAVVQYPPIDERIRFLLERAQLLLWSASAGLRFETLAGALQCEEMAGAHLSDWIHPGSLGIDPLAAASAALEGRVSPFHGRLGDCDVAGWMAPLYDRDSTIRGILGIALDETARRTAEKEASAALERCRTLFDTANEILFTHDFNGRITSVNGAVERLLGYTPAEALEMEFGQFLAPESRPLAVQWMHALMAGMTPHTWEATGLTKSRKRIALELRTRLLVQDGRPAGVEGIARDISERRALEERVQQAQKMDAIGVLAGGIAHDFNNLLTGILGYAYLLQSEPGLSPGAAEAVDVIVQSGQRAAQLTAQLLGFARRGKRQNVPVDLHATVREVVALLGRTIDKRIRIRTSLRAPDPHVMGDPSQIYQLILNLCLNARDAMPSGGDLSISTREQGENAVLAVADTGTGMTPEVRARIFEPFFTTKAPDKGTGMGLAMVYGIAKNHGGMVYVDTEVGKGSVFHVVLPLCTARAAPRRDAGAVSTGTGRILIIDDEDVVRRVLTKMLEGLGYDVVSAGDTAQAIRYYSAHHQEIDLVILDMMMPKMSGAECFRAIKAANPDVRAVFSSGYSPDADAVSSLKEETVEFLQKPYNVEQLAGVIRKALSQKART